MFNIRVSTERRTEVHANIAEISRPKQSYYLMISLSTIIAAYGLLSNSTAVVIGAMLVAPLMGPIYGIALSLSLDDRPLLKASIVSEITGIIFVILISVLIGIIPFNLGYGSEIINRTQPTLYDVLIAFASGLAGAYGLIDKRLSSTITGVAIATALVPPLSSCGLCIAIGNWKWAIGAFSLFFANLISIELAAALIFFLSGLVTEKKIKSPSLAFEDFTRRFAPRIAIFLILGVFMSYTLMKMIDSRQFKEKLTNALSKQVKKSIYGAKLLDTQFKKENNKVIVIADIVTPHEFEPSKVKNIETQLQKKLNSPIYLVIRNLISKGVDHKGQVFLLDSEIQDLKKKEAIEKQAKIDKDYIDSITSIINSQLKEIPGAKLDNLTRTSQNKKNTIWLNILTPKAIEPQFIAKLENNINKKIDKPISLFVRSTITRDADSQKFLYEEKKKEPTKEEIALINLHKEITKILKIHIPKQIKGASLKKISFKSQEGKEMVFVEVTTPKPFLIKDVKNIEIIINKKIPCKINLYFKSIIGFNTTSAQTNVPKTPSKKEKNKDNKNSQ